MGGGEAGACPSNPTPLSSPSTGASRSEGPSPSISASETTPFACQARAGDGPSDALSRIEGDETERPRIAARDDRAGGAPYPAPMKQLLIIWHSRTGAAEAMARAAFEGAQGDEACGARLVRARAAEAEDLLAADGYLFAAPENLASLSGEMKEFFDRCYYPVLGRIEGRPYALMIAAGSDGDGAARQAARICKGWRLRDVQPPLIVGTRAQTAEEILAPKVLGEDALAQCRELGAGMAAGIGAGIW